ncbi:MAG: choice-of-anchor L domain-containing protein [Flavobacterium sp.]
MKKITYLLIFLFSLVGYSQFSEGFEGSTNLPIGWSKYQEGFGMTKTWSISSLVTDPPSICEGNNAVFVDIENLGDNNTSYDYLVTPQFKVPNNGQLRFYSRQGLAGDQGTIYQVKISTVTDGGVLGSYETIEEWKEFEMNTTFNICQEQIVDISDYKGQVVYIAFVKIFTQPPTPSGSAPNRGDRWFLDKVSVVSKCLDPSAAVANSVTATTANLDWVDNNASKWEIELVPSGSVPKGNVSATTMTKPYTAMALQPDLAYDYYIRSVCDTDNKSIWIGPFSFKTLPLGVKCEDPIAVSSLPYQTSEDTGNYADLFDGPQNTAVSCGATPSGTNYLDGNDVFYSYKATKNGVISVKMIPTTKNSSVFIYGGCPVSGPCLAGMADITANQRYISSIPVTAGLTYYIVISSSAQTQTVGYTLILQEENCLPPDTLSANNFTTTSAQLSWGNPSNSSSWEVAVQTLGKPIPSGDGEKTDTNSFAAKNLIPATQYQYYVRSVCSNGQFSSWAGPYLFNTLICDGTNKCNYVFKMGDTGGNGWEGNSMDVRQNGIVVATIGKDFTIGMGPQSVQVTLCNNVPFDLYWSNSGGHPEQCSVSVINSFGQTLYVKPANTGKVGDIIYNGIVKCDSPACTIVPTSLSATAIGINTATLNWDPQGTTAWDIYVVDSDLPAPNALTLPTYSNVTTNTFNVEGLLAGYSYTFYVRSVCSPSPSDWSAGSIFTTVPTCYKPVGLSVPLSGITMNSAKISWSNESTTDNKWEILLVKAVGPTYGLPPKPLVTPVLNSGDILITVTSPPSSSPYTVTGLEPSTIYYYYMRTICSDTDKSAWAMGPVSKPSFSTKTCISSDKCDYTINLTSVKNGWNGGTMQIRQNGVVVSAIGGSISSQTAPPLTVSLCNGLPFDIYWDTAGTKPNEIGLAIYNPFGDPIYTKLPGEGEPLTVLFSSTGNCIPPSCAKPTFPKLESIASTSATLSWTQSGAAEKWEVYVVPAGGKAPINGIPVNTQPQPPFYSADTNLVTITGLDPSSTYDFYVRAICSGSDATAWTLNDPKTFATTPVNDECNNSVVVSVNNGMSYVVKASGNTKGATDTAHLSACQGYADDDIWYSFTATSTTHIILLKNIVGNTTDVNHILYSGTDCAALTQLYCSATNISLATNLTEGKEYKIRVYTGDKNDTGNSAKFDIYVLTPAPVVNNECVNAIDLPVNADLPCIQSARGTLTAATASFASNTCIGNANDDVWYKFVATSNKHYVTISNIVGTSTNINHAVYIGSCDGLQLLYCSAASSLASNSGNFVIGQTYYVRVWSNSTDPQIIDFNICLGTVPPPIVVDDTKSMRELVEDVLLGTKCANVTNITYSTGTDPDNVTAGFPIVNGIGYFEKSASSFAFKDGIILSTGAATSVPGPNVSVLSEGGPFKWKGDSQLEAIIYAATGVKGITYNASKIEFDFVPFTDKISFNFMYASEEYGEYQCQETSTDAFAFLLTNKNSNVTKNLAVVPNTSIPITTTKIRDRKYSPNCTSENAIYFDSYYGTNGKSPISAPINFNGITKPMVAQATVVPGETYHIKLVIADRQDFKFDSAIFLEGGSMDVGKLDLGSDLLVATNNALCKDQTYMIKSLLSADLFDIKWLKDGKEIAGETSPNLTISDAATYTIQAHLKNTNCDSEDSLVVEYYPFIATGTPVDIFECGDSGKAVFDLTKNSPIILAPLNPDSTVSYFTSLTDANNSLNAIPNPAAFTNDTNQQLIYARINNSTTGCSQIVSFTVNVKPSALKYSLSGKKLICPTEPTTINVTPVENSYDPQSVTYTWTYNGTVMDAKGSSIILNGSKAYGTYTVSFKNGSDGCADTQTFDIAANQVDKNFKFENAPYVMCLGGTTTISISSVDFDVNDPDIKFLWTAPDGTQTTGKTLTAFQIGTYTLEVDYYGCKTSKTTEVIEDTSPIMIAFTQGCLGNSYQLSAHIDDNTQDAKSAVYKWSTNDGVFTVSDNANTIILKKAGTYTVNITTAEGCSSEELKTVSDFSCTIPKGISPDGDGMNDKLDLTALNVNRLEIFNRYGTVVYKKDNYKNEWEGQSNNGDQLPDGTYFYLVHYEQNKKAEGWIYINRKQK